MVRLACCSLLVLAACPPRSQPVTPPPPQPAGAGCPSAKDVYVASYLTQDAGKGRTGWVLPLHAAKVDASADYQALDAAAVAAAGMPAAPVGNIWLVAGMGAPCQAKLGGAYAAKIEGPPASVSYGYELDGCSAPADPQDASGVLLASQEPPSACQFEAPHPVAERLGAMDAKQQWQKPEKETPIPAALEPAIPAHECVAPGCQKLWAIAEIDVANNPVAWAGAVNWFQIGDPAAQCSWKHDQFSGFFIPSPNSPPVKITEGQAPDHPLALSAALVDRSGAHVLIADGPGEYATYDLTPGRVALGNHFEWMIAPSEAWEMLDHLGPVCEAPPATTPAAPLPKDAKPQSPYP
ncbi:MAG TPA: hypothetical protein VFQ65_13515 [Kofleriaceae bacterium]|nr:hypothetical protein [Kofleriaceae bacterium]